MCLLGRITIKKKPHEQNRAKLCEQIKLNEIMNLSSRSFALESLIKEIRGFNCLKLKSDAQYVLLQYACTLLLIMDARSEIK